MFMGIVPRQNYSIFILFVLGDGCQLIIGAIHNSNNRLE